MGTTTLALDLVEALENVQLNVVWKWTMYFEGSYVQTSERACGSCFVRDS